MALNDTKTSNIVEAETQDEIEQIMQEIESLQKDMAEASTSGMDDTASGESDMESALAMEEEVQEAVQESVQDIEDRTEPSLAVEPAAGFKTTRATSSGNGNGNSNSVVSAGAAMKELFGTEQGDDSDFALEDTLGTMKSEETETSLFDDSPKSPAGDHISEEEEKMIREINERVQVDTTSKKRHSLPTEEASAAKGALTLTLAGSMSLKLRYESEGNEILISFADEALRVELEDGTEFKIPMGRGRRKIA